MLEDDTHSSQSTQESVDLKTTSTKKSKSTKAQHNINVKRANRKTKELGTKPDSTGLTKLNKSLFRTPTNPKGIIKAVKSKSNSKKSKASVKESKASNKVQVKSKGITHQLGALKEPRQNLTVFTKNIIKALYELNEKNE